MSHKRKLSKIYQTIDSTLESNDETDMLIMETTNYYTDGDKRVESNKIPTYLRHEYSRCMKTGMFKKLFTEKVYERDGHPFFSKIVMYDVDLECKKSVIYHFFPFRMYVVNLFDDPTEDYCHAYEYEKIEI